MNNAKLIYPPQATDSYIPKTLRLDIKYQKFPDSLIQTQ
jgi:hypothetical protein